MREFEQVQNTDNNLFTVKQDKAILHYINEKSDIIDYRFALLTYFKPVVKLTVKCNDG